MIAECLRTDCNGLGDKKNLEKSTTVLLLDKTHPKYPTVLGFIALFLWLNILFIPARRLKYKYIS
jgi:hypothetical protein